MIWTLLLSVTFAGAPELLGTAANADLEDSERMAAFESLVAMGATDLEYVRTVSVDGEADFRKRWVAVRVLGQVESPQSRDILLNLLGDGMPALRAAAASGLGDLGDALVTERLCDLLEDESLLVRATASDALGAIGDARAVEPLSRSLAAQDNYYRGQSLWVRRHYVEALGEIGHKTAIPALLQGLDDVDNDVVRASVLAMEDIAGFSYADGRDFDEERRAWQRWASSQIQSLR